MHTSQPGVSRQLKLLEEELGFQLFEREGRALTRTTAAGEEIISRASSILREMQNIRRTSAELRKADGGTLSIATTHTQARYVLPQVIRAFRIKYPKVRLHLHQGTSEQIAEMVARDRVDFGHCHRLGRIDSRTWCDCPCTTGIARWSCRAATRWHPEES